MAGSAPEVTRSRRRFVEIDPGDAILQFATTVLAILLALAVNNWQAGIHQRAVLRGNVVMLLRELETNQRMLLAVKPQHEREKNAIWARAERGLKNKEYMSFEIFFAYFLSIAPHGLGPINMQDAAWQLTKSDSSISEMSSDDRLALGRIYEQQGRLQYYSDSMNVSLQAGNNLPVLVNLGLDFGDVVASEEQLAARYARIIPRLRKTYSIPPSSLASLP